MGVRGRTTGYQGIETQERIYQARLSAGVVGGVEDELRTKGWAPLTRELRTDGSLRVIYERFPDEVDRERPGEHSVPSRRSVRADPYHALEGLIAMGLLLVMFALVTRAL